MIDLILSLAAILLSLTSMFLCFRTELTLRKIRRMNDDTR